MTPTDSMGKAALNAAIMVGKFDFYLLGAAAPGATREARAACLEKVFAQWPKICRAMAELERLAPSASAAGYEEDGRLVDHLAAKSTPQPQRKTAA